MNITVVSMSVGEAWEPIASYTWEVNRNWCEKNGVLFASFSTLPSPPYPTADPRPTSWYRLLLLKRVLQNRGGLVVWIDADAILRPDVRPITLTPFLGSTIMTVWDMNGANCGLIAMMGGTWCEEFLDHWWLDALPEEINHVWWENKTFKRLLQADKDLQNHWCGTPTEDLIIHAAGVPVSQKLDWLKERSRS